MQEENSSETFVQHCCERTFDVHQVWGAKFLKADPSCAVVQCRDIAQVSKYYYIFLCNVAVVQLKSLGGTALEILQEQTVCKQ